MHRAPLLQQRICRLLRLGSLENVTRFNKVIKHHNPLSLLAVCDPDSNRRMSPDNRPDQLRRNTTMLSNLHAFVPGTTPRSR